MRAAILVSYVQQKSIILLNDVQPYRRRTGSRLNIAGRELLTMRSSYRPLTKSGDLAIGIPCLGKGVSVHCGLRVFELDRGWIRRRRCAPPVAVRSKAAGFGRNEQTLQLVDEQEQADRPSTRTLTQGWPNQSLCPVLAQLTATSRNSTLKPVRDGRQNPTLTTPKPFNQRRQAGHINREAAKGRSCGHTEIRPEFLPVRTTS